MLDRIPGVSKSGESLCLEHWLLIVVYLTFSILAFALLLFISLSIRELWLMKKAHAQGAEAESEKDELIANEGEEFANRQNK
ncbi:uncharacterized protein L203_102854 [Cryptococcus depauperatus CBS 7841]|uniref:Uncharacterized protein n=1 Tax=Cryptococcus depauperatus CBS 7841 TaxID=1295531 RepID=A0A1E3IB27_9TREE|nr:hypothetical protein L203_04655 [Cryptococcus depauperatus CBS 7841]